MSDEIQAKRLKAAEETRRVPDAGYRMQAAAAEKRGTDAMFLVQQILKLVSLQDHPELPAIRKRRQILGNPRRIASIYQDGVHAKEARRWFAQRASREEPSVAESARCVDHADLDVTVEAIMLQTVVADEDVAVGTRGEERAARCGPVRAYPHLAAAAAREQYRFVAAVERIGIVRDAVWRHMSAAVAAAEDTGRAAVPAQVIGNPQHRRRFAGAACSEVADDDYRYRELVYGR